MNTFLAILGGLLLVVMVLGYVLWSSSRLPALRPETAARPSDGAPVVALLGDSLTHGRVGAPWVEQLALPDEPNTLFVNGGINGELAWNVLQRLDPVVALQPAAVTLLVGTNDALGTLSDTAAERYSRTNNLPERPSLEGYEANLRAIVDRLQRDTEARIALLSIPPISEVPGSEAWQRAEAINAIIRRVAEEAAVAYLPLHECFVRELDNVAHTPTPYSEDLRSIVTASARYYLTPASWNDIAESRGMHLLTDHIHWNERGAAITAKLVNEWLAIQPASNG